MPKQVKTDAFTRTFSIYPKHLMIVTQVQRTFRRRNLSDALQFILEDYVEIKARDGVALVPATPTSKAA